MKLAGALVILGAALLLTAGRICPAIKQYVHLFFYGTPEEYVEYVKKYKHNPEIVENTEKLKKCVHIKLTDEDKAHVTAFIGEIEASLSC
uniref:Uncharacterized protein n=1 Tax=Mus spicilegus TaxID=10103 RepID=A0A8C6HD79_MUSSI